MNSDEAEPEVAEAVGEAFGPAEAPEADGPDGGVEPAAPDDGGRFGGLLDALRTDEPHRPIEAVRGDVPDADSLADDWSAYGLRAAEKLTGSSTREAWVDMLLAAVGAGIWATDDADGAGIEGDGPTEAANSSGADMGGEVPE